MEAVVENEAVKKKVLAEVEGLLPESAILTSNTSTISITRLATALKRPESFCGMHFFNPVPRMPLVEVIRGEKSSPEAIATAVAYAQAMGKTPIVVGDCGGFLVNRVLFPYFAGFQQLVADGVDYERIDKVMEKWGWPMGPALLLDVVGIDTGVHADKVLADAFPDRMRHEGQSAIEAHGRGGPPRPEERQGLLRLEAREEGPAQQAERPRGEGDRGRLSRRARSRSPTRRSSSARCCRCSSSARAASRTASSPPPSRWTSPFSTASGFPPFRGGIFRWADSIGTPALLKAAEKHKGLGALYAPTKQLTTLAGSGRGFHGE